MALNAAGKSRIIELLRIFNVDRFFFKRGYFGPLKKFMQIGSFAAIRAHDHLEIALREAIAYIFMEGMGI